MGWPMAEQFNEINRDSDRVDERIHGTLSSANLATLPFERRGEFSLPPQLPGLVTNPVGNAR